MNKLLQTTESVCPVCLQTIKANLIENGNHVYLEKKCEQHGRFSTRVWSGPPDFSTWSRPKIPFKPTERKLQNQGCPKDCGLCQNHNQRTCTALIEITSRCNLTCPVCFAGSEFTGKDIQLSVIERMLRTTFLKTHGCNLQISGGEPTLHKDLVTIVQIAKEIGFTFIQLNSNGIELARSPSLAHQLKDAGLSSVFLQFDGLNDHIYKKLRGINLISIKRKAISHLSHAGIGIVLVPTIVKDINSDSLYEIVDFAINHTPHIRGVHFQPISFFGRVPNSFLQKQTTLPEIMAGLAQQSNKQLLIKDFTPPACEHALCSFSAKYIIGDKNSLIRLGANRCTCSPTSAEKGALNSIKETARRWGTHITTKSTNSKKDMDDLDRFLLHANQPTLSISGMAFQDAWSMNLQRLQGCCIHVVQQNGDLIPFCSYNLTNKNGEGLHRKELLTIQKDSVKTIS